MIVLCQNSSFIFYFKNYSVSISKFADGSSNKIILLLYKYALAKNNNYLFPILTSWSFKNSSNLLGKLKTNS